MTVKIRRWGNSLGLRIAKPLAREMCLLDGAEVDLKLEGGRLVVVPVRSLPRYTLASLLSRATPSRLHKEVGSGGPAGRESW